MRFDLSALVVIGLFVWIGHRRGLLLTAVGFISSLISIAIAFLLVRPISGWLFELGLFSGTMNDISDQINDSVASAPTTISPVLERLGLPETWTRKILQGSSATGNSLVDTTVNSVWQLVLSAFALIVVFVIVRIAIGLVARLLTPVLNGIPVIGWFNRTGGLLLGLLWGVFMLWIIVMVLTSFSLTSSVVRSFMNGSRILALLSEKDIFRSLLDTIF